MKIRIGTIASTAAAATLSLLGASALAADDGGLTLGGLKCLFAPNSSGCQPAAVPKSKVSQPKSTSKTSSTSTGAASTTPTAAATLAQKFKVLAWNDLGMHCVDGKDYSVMSILPPYNNLHAQVIDPATGKQVVSGIRLTYESMADPSASINTVSSTKTNFWQWVKPLYGAQPAPDRGLNLSNPAVSNPTPSKTAAPMSYNTTLKWYEAEGIPITPYDDAGNKNYYPMVKVVARDSKGNVVGSTQTVLPVSDEMTCKACHATGASADAQPTISGWANLLGTDPEKDWKVNILRLHDDKHANDPVFKAAMVKLTNSGFTSLAYRATQGQPTLCASCHGSNALNSPGFTLTVNGTTVKVSALTSAIHSKHGQVKNPANQLALDTTTTRDSCYLCHPGSATKCLRGAMSETPGLDCQSCHGNMAAVGAKTRVGWLQQPNCQSCHHDGKRETVAVTNVATGALRQVTDARFATNANKPAAGFSLFRFSTGHGGLQCEACHGSTHAEYSRATNTWSSSHDNDILQSKAIQGYAGTITECAVCHASVPLTTSGGPHGMHTIGAGWVDKHGDVAEKSASACAYCHGADFRGSPLAKAGKARSYSHDGRTYTIAAGTNVGCYNCHNGPKGD